MFGIHFIIHVVKLWNNSHIEKENDKFLRLDL